MKKSLFISILISLLSANLQAHEKMDTLIFVISKFKTIESRPYKIWDFRRKNDSIVFNGVAGEQISQSEFHKYTKANNSFIKFYDSRGRLIEEGYWDFENFNGAYKSYHRSGHLKSEGRYYNNIKVGKWKYYNKRGEFIREVCFPSSEEM